MSSTVYVVHAFPKADTETLKRVYSAKENHDENGYLVPGKVLDDLTRNYGWKPALGEPILQDDCISGSHQLDVVEYRMPDGHRYSVLLSYVLNYKTDCYTDQPEVILYNRVRCNDDFLLLGYEPDGDNLVVTYGEQKDVYQFHGYTIGTTTVATVDPKDEFCLLGKVPYIEKLYLEAFLGEKSPFKTVEFRKAVAVPDDCFAG